MKIGILTFHCAHNYGAVLQCYALQEVLKRMGHTVEVMDYRPAFLKTAYDIVSFRRIYSRNPLKILKSLVSEFLCLPERIRRYKGFDRFIKNRLRLSSPDIPSDCDVYIMGSDQIWNPGITQGFDGVYFGYLPFSKGARKYLAYAASMEREVLADSEKDYLQKALCNFDTVSVRETHLANLLQPLTEKKVSVVLDPTLLADSSVWNVFLGQRPMKRKYVLVYQVRVDENTLRIARHIAGQLDAEVVAIASFPTWRRSRNLYKTEPPEAFVNWIKHASCVVTTSFHGTAFSIILNRPFYSLALGAGDTRAVSLLKMVGLEERMIAKDSLPTFQEIDYEGRRVTDRLERYRKESCCFLEKEFLGQGCDKFHV